ncbi:MAG: radical SAM protein [Candidatus Lokiarchaeota archaeon]|nr:radical SAM protein [Candidatus Lokiarchaeota archaeon]
MRVLLIYPPFPLGEGMNKIIRSPPLSLLNLAGMIPDHEVEILDLNLYPTMTNEFLENKMKDFDLIGISCMSSQLGLVLKLCEIAKKHDIKTIVGGFHPTLSPDMIEYPNIDYIVRGEGEYAFKELLDGINPAEILGLSYKINENGNEGFQHNEPRPLIQNLDELPYPRKDLLDYSKYHYLWVPADVIESSRGCPYNCNFCCVAKFYCRTYRAKSPQRIMKELAQVPKGTKLIFFVDDNFTLDAKRVDKICDLLIKYGFHKRLLFVCQSRVDFVTKYPDLVKKMSKAGFLCFFLGFESLKQMSLNKMRKQITLSQAKNSVRICHENRILVFGAFIIGTIGETRQDTLDNIKNIRELGVDFMMTNPITPFPGTELWDEAMENGWIDKDFKWENWDFRAVMRTPDLSKEELKELTDYSYKYFYSFKRFLNPKKLLNIFNARFWRVLKDAPGFVTGGLKDFLLKI